MLHTKVNCPSTNIPQLLCELQVAMLERGLMQQADVTRHVMTKSMRHVEDESFRNLRDWIIYRDYMNGLEYVEQAFSHLKNRRYH